MTRRRRTEPEHRFAAPLDVALRAFVPAWEHVGSPLPEAITVSNISQVRQATGLDWEPEVEPQYRRVHVATVGDEPLYEYAEPKGAGGEVAGGKRVFLMADLGTRELPGDPSPHVRYLGMVSSHDSSAALKVIGTDMRWTCTNMIKASEIDAQSKGTAFAFRHSSNMVAKVRDAVAAIRNALFQLDTVHKVSGELLATPISTAQRGAWIDQFALARVIGKSNPTRQEQAERSHQRQSALTATVNELTTILNGPTCEGIAGTAYGPFAAAVEFLDHHRPARSGADGLFSRQILNTEPGKVLALDTLRHVLKTT